MLRPSPSPETEARHPLQPRASFPHLCTQRIPADESLPSQTEATFVAVTSTHTWQKQQLASTPESMFTFSLAVQQSYFFFSFEFATYKKGSKTEKSLHTQATGDHKHVRAAPAMRLKANVAQFFFWNKNWKPESKNSSEIVYLLCLVVKIRT